MKTTDEDIKQAAKLELCLSKAYSDWLNSLNDPRGVKYTVMGLALTKFFVHNITPYLANMRTETVISYLSALEGPITEEIKYFRKCKKEFENKK